MGSRELPIDLGVSITCTHGLVNVANRNDWTIATVLLAESRATKFLNVQVSFGVRVMVIQVL